MAGMKITVDAAMRARDVSRPLPADEAAAEAEAAAPRSAWPGDLGRPARPPPEQAVVPDLAALRAASQRKGTRRRPDHPGAPDYPDHPSHPGGGPPRPRRRRRPGGAAVAPAPAGGRRIARQSASARVRIRAALTPEGPPVRRSRPC